MNELGGQLGGEKKKYRGVIVIVLKQITIIWESNIGKSEYWRIKKFSDVIEIPWKKLLEHYFVAFNDFIVLVLILEKEYSDTQTHLWKHRRMTWNSSELGMNQPENKTIWAFPKKTLTETLKKWNFLIGLKLYTCFLFK